ncbi:fimbrillin family protein [Bacteroides timonensis]|uniref:fimbrillin family protein n=1 Tax=Bacteroides timonensis TaxID=1470345 RepID=UPI0005C6E8E9|nr:fimbrillin family protein [Bacteroides timonensis]
MKRKGILQTAFMLTAVLLLAAACTQDELSGGKGEPLPEGKYPMTFATTVEGVTATRATTDNTWAGGEEVAVQVVGTANPKKYTASTDGKLSAATDETPFYWKSTTEEKIVSAWYPYTATKPSTFIVKKDQSGTVQSGTDGYQESDLIYVASQKVTYSGSKALTFKHLPVKVVVNLKAGNGVTADEVKGATVTIVNQATESGAITEGTTSTDATTGGTTTADWSVAQVTSGDIDITPKKVTPAATDCQKSVQALLVPRQMKGVSFIKVTAGGNDYYYTPEKETDANLQAGQQYTYTITVTKNGLTVTASGAAEWTGTEKDPVTGKVPETGFSASDLKAGDYFYSDGTWSDGGYRKYPGGTTATLPIMPVLTDASGNARTVSGIVLHLRNKSSVTDNCNYESFTGVPTGYVLSVDEKETNWGTTDGTECKYNNEIFGYAHTKLFSEKPNMTTTAIDWCKNHDTNAPVSPPSSVAVSTWYMPSQQELKMITTDLRPVLDAILSRIGGTPFQNKYYFTSGLMGLSGGYVWMYNPITGNDNAGNLKNNARSTFLYRAMFAFQLQTPVSKQNHR